MAKSSAWITPAIRTLKTCSSDGASLVSMLSTSFRVKGKTCAIFLLSNESTNSSRSCRHELSGCYIAITSNSHAKSSSGWACERDLEGIVAKRKFDPYLPDRNVRWYKIWYKIRNRNYSQWVGREELFERERDSDPEWQSWNLCTSACDELILAHGRESC